MIDLPDHGYVNHSIGFVDAGGIASGALGGPSDIVDRPGLRFRASFVTPQLNMEDARIFQTLLEQGLRDYVSYPFPLDFRPLPSGPSTSVNGTNPAGSTISLQGFLWGYTFKEGQPFAIKDSNGFGYIHRAKAPVTFPAGSGTVSIWPWTRKTFINGHDVEIEKPRIRGVLSWEGSDQGAFGARSFGFSITEAR